MAFESVHGAVGEPAAPGAPGRGEAEPVLPGARELPARLRFATFEVHILPAQAQELPETGGDGEPVEIARRSPRAASN